MAPKTTLNPPTFRYPFASEISDQPIGVQNAHRAAFQGIQDLQQAVTALNSKMTTSTTTPTAATTTVTENFSQTVIAASTIIGTVNNQTGVTSYSTQQSDYGAFLIFNDASPVAVTLSTLSTSPAIALPWFASFINSGTGTVTLTPATGLIEGGATFQIHASNAITVVFDGTNFYVEAPGAQPQNTPAVTHEWLNSFSSITGTFGQTQPAYADISGLGSAATYAATGAGGYVPTGPNTSTNGDLVYFTGTAGEIADSGILYSNVPLLNASNTFTGTTNTFKNIVSGSGTTGLTIEPYTGGGFSALYSTAVTPSTVNYAVALNATNTVINAVNTLVLAVNTVAYFQVTTAGVALVNASTSTTATTGGASALPSDPAGYLEISINSTTYKIPYYNV